MIRKAIIAVLSCSAGFLMLFVVMMLTSESIWSVGTVYDQGTKIRVGFAERSAVVTYCGPLRAWWPAGLYTTNVAEVELYPTFVGSTVTPPDLVLKSAALATLRPLSTLWIAAAGLLLSMYPTVTIIRGPLRRWRRRRKGLCVECSYDLTGNVSGVCPECGARMETA